MVVLPEYVSAGGTLLGSGEEQLEQWDHRLFPTILIHFVLDASIKQLQENSAICLLRALLSESWNWLKATIAMVTNGFTKKGLKITLPMTHLSRFACQSPECKYLKQCPGLHPPLWGIFLLEFHQHSWGSVAFNLEWTSVATLVDVVARETIHSFKKILTQKQTTYPLLAGVTS